MSSTVKIVIASQAKIVYHLKNLKRKVLKCGADIYFNKQCLKLGLTPTFAKIAIPHTSPAAIHTQQKTVRIRLQDEIKFLYIKKTQLNKQLYYAHLAAANEWKNNFHTILASINESLTLELQTKYQTLDKKSPTIVSYTK
jgi:hypothetical protein